MSPPTDDDRGLARREFLRRSAVTGGAAAVAGFAPLAERALAAAAGPGIKRRPTLGRTGVVVPDIGFGGSRLAGETGVVRHALDRGITHFDTADAYGGGASEETLGRALVGHRDEVTLTTKTRSAKRSNRTTLMGKLEDSLRRLRTDRVEIYLNHAVNHIPRIDNDEWYEFVAAAKQQGKIRAAGFSGHGGNLVECIDHAVANDQIDALLVGFNFGQDPAFYARLTKGLDFVAVQPELPRALAAAKAKGVGVMAMKTLRGARLNDLRPYEGGGATFAQAAFRWVLSHDFVDSLVVTMKQREQVDEYVAASGWQPPTSRDLSLLERYDERNGATQCRYGCSACESACPVGVPIADVLRTRMYARDYDDVELGRSDYGALGAGASPCLSCSGAPCAEACPFGLRIPELTRDAASLLAERSA
jgi:predicted aldo/keto reductase-like oxidoreductase